MISKKGYTAVQFGTYTGNDEFYSEIKNIDATLIVLVEPNDKLNTTIKEHYKDIGNVHLENIAIHPDENLDSIQLHECHCVTSFSLDHILKHKSAYDSVSDIKPFDVRCLSPNQLFEKYNLSLIDLLYVDVEGLDEIVIHSIDFDRYEIKKLVYEHLHINNKRTKDFLRSKGYTEFTTVEYNTVCEK